MLDPVKDEALYWFARLRAPEVSEEDHAQFSAWLASSPHHAEAWRSISEMWDSPAFLSAVQAGRLNRSKAHEGSKIQIPRPRSTGYALWLSACAATALMLLVYTLRLDILLLADYRNGAGPPLTVHLPDGSRLTLDANSAIATAFDQGTRSIKLLGGRAYFEVKSNPAVPFTVATPLVGVRVIGTQFVVDAASAATLVSVREGRVGVTSAASPTDTQVLETGFELLANQGGLSTPAMAAVDRFEWTDSRMRVRNRPLGEVVGELARYQPGLVYVRGADLAAMRVSGSFDLGDPIGVIYTLAASVGAFVVGYPEVFLIVQRP